MGKLTRCRVLRGGAGLQEALRSGDGVRKFFLSCGAGQQWGKTKLCEAGAKTPSFEPAPTHCFSLQIQKSLEHEKKDHPKKLGLGA